ncbi:carotenoid oxygenase family protein [Nonomuraea ferruginea]
MTGVAKEETLGDRSVEFPTLGDERVGRGARYLYAVAGPEIVKYDLSGGEVTGHALPEWTSTGEAVFVPATSGPRREDDGWLITITTTLDGNASRLLVLDASDVAAGPVATVHLPRGVPTGFHGTWFPDEPS